MNPRKLRQEAGKRVDRKKLRHGTVLGGRYTYKAAVANKKAEAKEKKN